MVRNIRRAMVAICGLALTAAISLQSSAQDDMAELDVMQEDASVAADYGKGCGKGCCDDCCCSGSVYGEFQYLRLESYSSEGDAFTETDESVGYQDGYRIVAGYEGCDGLGARVRYFDFDGVTDIDGDEGGLDLQYFDIEITQSFNLCCLDGVVSAGYRHADYEVVFEDDLFTDFEGDGITLGMQLQRDIGCNVSLFAWVQHSILFGDDDESDFPNDHVMGWTEVQLGAQYDTCLGGYNVFVRGGVEAQRHEGAAEDDTEDTGLLGWFVSGGVSY